MYFRVFIKFRVCTCIHDTRYTIHDIDDFRVYTVTSLVDEHERRANIARRSARSKYYEPPPCKASAGRPMPTPLVLVALVLEDELRRLLEQLLTQWIAVW